MNIKLIDLNRQYDKIRNDINSEFDKIFDKSSFIMGENVKNFEKEFADYIGVNNAISVANGTDALVIALKTLGIGEGDEVITTPYSFFATAESISRVGAIPIFVDVNIKTYNIDENLIEGKITDKTKAILPVHIFGQPCNMNKINEIAKKYHLFVIEDACQAVGAKYDNKMIGSLSDIACFSFFPTKNLGCAGDGGMIVTNDSTLATICRAYRTHGSGKDGNIAYNILNNIDANVVEENSNSDNTVYNPMKYFNYIIGYNSRLDELQAAILRIKLPKLEECTLDRIETVRFYNEKLLNTDLTLPFEINNIRHVYHLYILQSDKRKELTDYLKEKGIATGIYYQVPLHLQVALEKYNYVSGCCPNAEYLSERTFAIPLFPGITDEERNYIVNNIIEWCDNNGK